MKNKIIKFTFILTIGGLITKLLGMIIKIVLTRTIGQYAMGIYSLILPTYLVLVNISMFSLPNTLNILISTNKYNNKNLIATSLLISLIINSIIMIFIIFGYKYIALNLLKSEYTELGILSIGFILPFISISNIFRSYIFAKEKIKLHVLTNIIEDTIKLLLFIFVLPKVISKGINITVAFIFLTNIICELSSIIIFLVFIPKFKATKKDIIPNIHNTKEILKISLPALGSRLISTLGYFLEPIILTFVLLKVGYTTDFIINEYGIINGYVLQLVLLPSFFTLALSQAIIPTISKAFANKKYKYVKNKIIQAIIISILIGIPFTIIFILFPKQLLNILFKTTKGVKYIKVLAPIAILHYIQAILSTSLQSINKSKTLIKTTFIGTILRCITLYLFSLLKIGLFSLVIATSINILYTTLSNAKQLFKYLDSLILNKQSNHLTLDN